MKPALTLIGPEVVAIDRFHHINAITVTPRQYAHLFVVQFKAQEGGGRISGDMRKFPDYTPILCCCINNTLPPSTGLFLQLQVQRKGHLLIAQKAGSIPRPFEWFHDRKTRSQTLTALSLILVKDLLVSCMYTFTGESKLQNSLVM